MQSSGSKIPTGTRMAQPSVGLSRRQDKARDNLKSTRPAHPFRGFAKLDAFTDYQKLGEGTFGVVFKAKTKGKSQDLVAIKKVIERKVDIPFPLTAFREMEALKTLRNKHIIGIVDFIMDNDEREGKIMNIPGLKTPDDVKTGDHYYMVFPYMPYDLAGILLNPNVELDQPSVKSIMFQLFKGLDYLHTQNYIHRDIKTANILIDFNGVVKIADLGLIRKFKDKRVTYDTQGAGNHGLTPVVMTRWYRAPECVFQYSRYGTAVDMWSAGCVFGELFEKKPILKGDTDINQGHEIFKLVGFPTEETMPGWKNYPLANRYPGPSTMPGTLPSRFGSQMTPDGVSLLSELLTLDPETRITARKAMDHDYFKTDPLPLDKVKVGFEECHESDKDRFRMMRSKLAQTAGNSVMPSNNNYGQPQQTYMKQEQHSQYPSGPPRHPQGNNRNPPPQSQPGQYPHHNQHRFQRDQQQQQQQPSQPHSKQEYIQQSQVPPSAPTNPLSRRGPMGYDSHPQQQSRPQQQSYEAVTLPREHNQHHHHHHHHHNQLSNQGIPSQPSKQFQPAQLPTGPASIGPSSSQPHSFLTKSGPNSTHVGKPADQQQLPSASNRGVHGGSHQHGYGDYHESQDWGHKNNGNYQGGGQRYYNNNRQYDNHNNYNNNYNNYGSITRPLSAGDNSQGSSRPWERNKNDLYQNNRKRRASNQLEDPQKQAPRPPHEQQPPVPKSNNDEKSFKEFTNAGGAHTAGKSQHNQSPYTTNNPNKEYSKSGYQEYSRYGGTDTTNSTNYGTTSYNTQQVDFDGYKSNNRSQYGGRTGERSAGGDMGTPQKEEVRPLDQINKDFYQNHPQEGGSNAEKSTVAINEQRVQGPVDQEIAQDESLSQNYRNKHHNNRSHPIHHDVQRNFHSRGSDDRRLENQKGGRDGYNNKNWRGGKYGGSNSNHHNNHGGRDDGENQLPY